MHICNPKGFGKQNKTKKNPQMKHNLNPRVENRILLQQMCTSMVKYLGLALMLSLETSIVRSIIIEQWPTGAEVHTQHYSGYHRKVSVKVGQLDCGDWLV